MTRLTIIAIITTTTTIIIISINNHHQSSSYSTCPGCNRGPAPSPAPSLARAPPPGGWAPKIMHQIFCKDYAPNIFFKESAQNILQRLGTKYFANNLHQIACNSYNCWEKKIMQQILRQKLYMTIKYFGQFFSNYYARNYTCWPWNIMLLLLFVNKGGNDVLYIGKGSQKNGYFLWNLPWRRRGLGCH